MQIIKRCKSNNASKFDDISNKILKILCAKIMLSLISLFRACVELNYYSLCFRIAHIITFKKLNKKNYSNVKTYKLIILLNTLNKILESIITRHINDLAKTHDMFSISQMSDRKNRSCETALKLLIEQIHIVWNMKKNKITTFLSMNVIDVYDHVFKNKLLHNLRKRDISNWIIRWTNNFMKNRYISLTFDNAMMTFRLIKANISQKSFISSIFICFTMLICWKFSKNHRDE
jgi:DNA integrity scanning protein DisA with diadenylate cyclase activity